MTTQRDRVAHLSTFTQRVLAACAHVPVGKVTTYARLAVAIGCPRAVRAVGTALGKNPCIGDIPCHRVVKSDGSIGGFARGTEDKIGRLRQEGISVENNRVVQLEKHLF